MFPRPQVSYSARLACATARHRHRSPPEHERAKPRSPASSRGLVSPTVDTLTTLLDLMGEELSLEAHAIDYGHDRAMIRNNLEHSPQERIERQAHWSRGMRRMQRAARG